MSYLFCFQLLSLLTKWEGKLYRGVGTTEVAMAMVVQFVVVVVVVVFK